MKVTIIVDPVTDTADEVHAMVDRVMGGSTAKAETSAEDPAAAKKAAAKKAAAKKAAAAAKKKETEEDDPGVTMEEVREKLKSYAALDSKDAAIKILKDNGAASISELNKGSYAAVIEACEKATAAKEEEEAFL